jgi:penicillin amidase
MPDNKPCHQRLRWPVRDDKEARIVTIDTNDLRAALPDVEGAVQLDDLDGPVDILRDRLGVPHIRASSTHDAFFAQGFAHAQDRLWQMDYDRRRAAGRWAEWAGPAWVDMDILMRRLGLAQSAETDYAAFDDETRAMFDAYAAGVNAFIGSTATLPVEYGLVGATPEPWQPWDGCAVYKVRHVLMGTFGTKLWRARILQTLGPEMVVKLRDGGGTAGPVVTLPGVEYAALPDAAESVFGTEALEGTWDWAAGSNNWALTGERTASGLPLLAGDPHRALEVPNVYYQNHVACPDFDVIGYSFAGVPGFPHFGHNAEVAWCITHAGADYHDLFIERFAPGDPTRYQFRGEWREADRRRETIMVRGGTPREIDVTVTHNGPIVVGDPADGYALALRYNATAGANLGFTTFVPMLRARTVAELDATMPQWVDPANNFLMADRQGTVGYLMRGQVPLRSRANAWLPVPGWTGEHEWTGQIPFEALPRGRDPQVGYFITANNRIVTDDYPYYVALDWAPGHRAARITSRLEALVGGATVADMAAIHSERRSLPSYHFTAHLDQLQPTSPIAEATRHILSAWNHELQADSNGAVVYIIWRECLTTLLIERTRIAELAAIPLSEEPVPLRALSIASRLRNAVVSLLAADDTTILPAGQGWDALLTEALNRAADWLVERLGPDPDAWTWAAIHQTAPKHTLSGIFPDLAAVLDPPAVGVGGDGDTPNAMAYAGLTGVGFAVTNTSVARYCFDLADWDNSGWVVPLGASGHPGSEHYADQITAWQDVRLLPMTYSWEKVETEAETRQRLQP